MKDSLTVSERCRETPRADNASPKSKNSKEEITREPGVREISRRAMANYRALRRSSWRIRGERPVRAFSAELWSCERSMVIELTNEAASSTRFKGLQLRLPSTYRNVQLIVSSSRTLEFSVVAILIAQFDT
ncbi:unnamed protein product [Calypogeia fissa]